MIARHPHMAGVLLSLMSVALMLFFYHDLFWWPVDEGVYAYIAQRMNAGYIIHKDIIDLHAGYGNLLNAWAFRLFGEDLLSLRYPLIAITLVQSIIAYILLASRGPFVACVGGIAVAAFSFVQFPNPSANWHALGWFFVLALCLEKLRPGSMLRLFLAGLLVGMCFFTRQLSGVFLALGLICVLLVEAPKEQDNPRGPALLIGAIASLGLILYVATKDQLSAFLWAGIWPLGLLITAMLTARFSWGYAGRTVMLVLAGFLIAGLPLAISNLSKDAFGFWLNDMLFSALSIHGQDFIAQASFWNLLQMAWQGMLSGAGLVASLSGLAWIFLILTVPALGIIVNRDVTHVQRCSPTAILAVFWAIGALHYQIPIYLMFVLPAVLCALLILRGTFALSVIVLAVALWAIAFQAGQPVERGLTGIIAGERRGPPVRAELPGVSLRLMPDDIADFETLLKELERTGSDDAHLMTIPVEPQLYFMTNRTPPVRYFSTAMGLLSDADVTNTITALDEAAPLNVVNRRFDKYLTPLSAQLLDHVKAHSEAPFQVGPFDVYRYAPEAASTSAP